MAGPKIQPAAADELVSVGGSGPAGLLEVESNRAMQQVQGQIVMAKKFPRDESVSLKAIVSACKEIELAREGLYEYERGGTAVTGLSIRSAEMIGQNWGNLDVGTEVLEREKERSLIRTYAWDLQTNFKQHMTFWVRHWRDRKNGAGYLVTDERDIYELCANSAARRRRECILAVVPVAVKNAAEKQILATLDAANKKVPLADRIQNMVNAFVRDFNIDQAMIEARAKKPVAQFTEAEFHSYARQYQMLVDGIKNPADFYHEAATQGGQAPGASSTGEMLNQRFSGEAPRPAARPEALQPSSRSAPGPVFTPQQQQPRQAQAPAPRPAAVIERPPVAEQASGAEQGSWLQEMEKLGSRIPPARDANTVGLEILRAMESRGLTPNDIEKRGRELFGKGLTALNVLEMEQLLGELNSPK